MKCLRFAAAASALYAAPVILMGCGPGEDKDKDPATPAPVKYGDCDHILMGTPESDSATVPSATDYDSALEDLNMTAVRQSMRELLVTDNPCWPADNDGSGPNYGGLMIRLAWHCAGTYRGLEGGCGGGRQRFEPERSWPDNTNLDKARALLYPLKEQYGDALSWGDLFILAGTTAYEMAGAPISRMCFGRMDEADGTASAILNEPCSPEQGNCAAPHGATTVGLIYVNPEGPLNTTSGQIMPDPKLSVAQIRRTFETMGHSDEATVALIGGGHTVGKAHGACSSDSFDEPFNPPNKAFEDGTEIWKGQCGETGKGADTLTSGFEGPWTTNYFKWDNDFFTELFSLTWTPWTGPGGKTQWKTDAAGKTNLIRLTSDISLLEDDAYRTIAESFRDDSSKFDSAFDAAWFKLTTTNVGGTWSPNAKCTDGTTPGTVMRSDAGPDFVV